MWDALWSVMQRGGPVMWPLLAVSLLAATLVIERVAFFASVNRPARWRRARRAAARLRGGGDEPVRHALEDEPGVYAAVLRDVTAHGDGGPQGSDGASAGDALFAETLETHRASVERFLPTLSTVITAAPMLGILGTVLGIIDSFELLSTQVGGTDPRSIGAGIAEALISTAAGLVVALLTLLPYNLIRAQADRTLARIEALLLSAVERPDGPADENAVGVVGDVKAGAA